jgi:predicted histone-like DNA-binding protein
VKANLQKIKKNMKYILRQMKNKALESYGRYYPRVVHTGEISTEQLVKNIADNQSIKKSDLKAAIVAISEELIKELQDGKVVELDYIGKFKLEVVASGVDDPKDFDQRRHVKRYICRFNPASSKGVKNLYQGIKLIRQRRLVSR